MSPRRPFAIPHRLRWAVGAAVLAGLLLALGLVQAQPPAPARAGVVIQFGDGRVTKACVALGDDGQATGEEALLAVGLPVIVEAGGLGAAVCKVDGEGCDYPATDCFCQCSLGAGTACRYWTYNRFVNGQWQLSNEGASSTLVRAGDVEGWVWGVGSVSSGARPPATTFDEVCAVAAQPTSTSTPTPTLASSGDAPSATPTVGPPAVYVPLVGRPAPATPTPEAPPSATSAPSATQPPPAQAATPSATAFPRPTGEPTVQSTAAPTVSPAAAAQPTSVVEAPTSAATATVAAATPTAAPTEPSATATSAPSPAKQPTEQPPTEGPRKSTQTSIPSSAAHTPSATAVIVAQAEDSVAAPTARPSAEPATQGRTDAGPPPSYLVLGPILAVLAVGWGLVRMRNRR